MAGKWKWVAVVILVLTAGGAFYFGRPIVQFAGVAAEYVAKRACLCVFVSERPLGRCIVEMPEMLAAVEAEVLEKEQAVRAYISFVAERTARYSEASGCVLD